MNDSAPSTTGENTLIELEAVKKYYDNGGLGPFGRPPVKAVDDVDFEIRRGETLGLVGESGSGKTTLGRTILHLESATEGTIRFDGQDITVISGSDLKEWRQNAQMVFQDPESSLNDRMTIGQIIREPLDAHNWKTPPQRRDRVRNLLSRVGLKEEHYARYPHQFSGGQRQRIGIARALALEPEFVVLDEPVSALDVSVQAQVLNLLEDIQAEFGLTYLFIAHDLSVVRHITDRVAVMYLGNIMELGPTEEIFESPANPYTISLLSAIPEPDPTSENNQITLRGTPPDPRDPPDGCPFSTRCPMKIRPPEYRTVDDDVWERIETFREVVRERARMNRSIIDRFQERLGLTPGVTDIEAVATDIFEDHAVPSRIQEHIDIAVKHVANGNPGEAQSYLREEFGSECDLESPRDHKVSGSGRTSHCHRHRSEYDSPTESSTHPLTSE